MNKIENKLNELNETIEKLEKEKTALRKSKVLIDKNSYIKNIGKVPEYDKTKRYYIDNEGNIHMVDPTNGNAIQNAHITKKIKALNLKLRTLSNKRVGIKEGYRIMTRPVVDREAIEKRKELRSKLKELDASKLKELLEKI